MNVRAKFMLTRHTHEGYGSNVSGHEFTFTPQYDTTIPEDQRFAKASPSGQMTIRVDNPPVAEYWAAHVGKQFYLDMKLADDDAA